MEYPVLVAGIHPHHVFDFLAFLVGGQLFWWALRRDGGLKLSGDDKITLAAGCIIGAAVGAKLLVLLEDPLVTLAHWREPLFWASGKTLVGGMLGGYVGIEVAKRSIGLSTRTGDVFVVPLLAGIAIGRVGCFLSGLTDDAYGASTTMPWGVDFGDGPRHPTQLYEIAFALGLLALVPWLCARLAVRGDLFRLTFASYFAFRFFEEFVRMSATPYFGLSIYQLACAGGFVWVLRERDVRARLAALARRAPPEADARSVTA